jgi:hypothetical protein
MISNRYGSVLACGTPLGRQRTFGSFSILFCMGASNSFCAAASIFEVWTLREGRFGPVPVMFTLPSGKRGTFFFS